MKSQSHLHTIRAAFSALAVFALLSSGPAQAANYTWSSPSGNGTWDLSVANTVWNNGSGNVSWTQGNATTPTNAAVFAGADGSYAVTVGEAVAATALTFSNSGYVLSASSNLTVALGGSLTVAATKSATIGTNVTVTRNTTQSMDVTGGGTLDIEGTGAILAGNFNLINVIGGSTVRVKAGGTMFSTSQLVVGTNSGNGTVIVDGGTIDVNSTVPTGNIVLANASTGASSATLTISGGTVLQKAASGGLRFGTTSGSATGTATGIANLDGGTLEVSRVYEGGGTNTQTSTFNFNGGTLRVNASANATFSGNFMSGLDNAFVKEGGAIIDTNGVNATMAQSLQHGGAAPTDGGLTKQGAGKLTLNGTSTFTGTTSVSAGTLLVSGGGLTGTSAIAVSGGSLELGASNVLNDAAPVSLSGGTLSAQTFSESVGALTLSGNSFISLGSGGTIAFADSSAATWGAFTIDITGFISGSSLRFGTDSLGLDGSQLAKFTAPGFESFSLDGNGYLLAAAVPEPGTWALVGLGLTFLLYRKPRRFNS